MAWLVKDLFRFGSGLVYDLGLELVYALFRRGSGFFFLRVGLGWLRVGVRFA